MGAHLTHPAIPHQPFTAEWQKWTRVGDVIVVQSIFNIQSMSSNKYIIYYVAVADAQSFHFSSQ